MSEWLDLMLEEVARKKSEAEEAQKEMRRRGEPPDEQKTIPPAQSK